LTPILNDSLTKERNKVLKLETISHSIWRITCNNKQKKHLKSFLDITNLPLRLIYII